MFRDVAALDASLGIDRTMAVSIKTKGKKKDERKEERSEEKAEPSEHDDKQTRTSPEAPEVDREGDTVERGGVGNVMLQLSLLVRVEDFCS